MKIEFEAEDRQALVQEIIEGLKPAIQEIIKESACKENNNKLMDVNELIKYLGISKKYVYDKVWKKAIPHIKRSGKLWFNKKDIDKWLAEGYTPAIQ